MMRVLVLRPEPGASATVRRARQRGLDALSLPLFTVEPVAWSPPDAAAFDGFLLTSANAVRHAGNGLRTLRGLPVHAVGTATAEAARDAGFAIASTGEAGVERLLDSIDADLKLLHLSGEDHKAPAHARQQIARIVVYRATAREGVDLSGAAGSVGLVHSPRAAQRFAALVETAGMDKRSIRIAAISREAAAAAGDGWAAIEAACEPSDEVLLALAERLCNNIALR